MSLRTLFTKGIIGLSLIAGRCPSVAAQTYEQLLNYADEQLTEGDVYEALTYYEKALSLDDAPVAINWKYAEALRIYKNYEVAEQYYQRVYDKENARIYPYSIFWLATMQQYNGNYAAALTNWKKCKKVFKRYRKGDAYKKSQAAIKACLWAQRAVLDTLDYSVAPLDTRINSEDTELAPFVHQGRLYFTSLKADSINTEEEVFTEEEEYTLQIYTAQQQDSLFQSPQRLTSLSRQGQHTANGSFSPDGKRFYFSSCDQNLRCHIEVAKVVDGVISDSDSLGTIVNAPDATTTMPHCTQIDGREYLFFCSDRKGTHGGLDIWYSVIRNGHQYSKARNIGRRVNSIEDDITPFYDTLEHRLYFSSSYPPGFGGHDLFYVQDDTRQLRFSQPVNLGIPFNSSCNDTYFTKDQTTQTHYWSSNRKGVRSAKHPTCCNDIFVAKLPVVPPPSDPYQSLRELNQKLPVRLYFHNDEPHPRTRDTSATITYLESYAAYRKRQSEYEKKYALGLTGEEAESAKEDIDDFFVQYVDQGVADLKLFLKLLLVELKKGLSLEITVRGFASPLAQSEYNSLLTKRRISSITREIEAYKDGILVPFMQRDALKIVAIPFGEYAADQLVSDNPNDKRQSVYSIRAALERKIELQAVHLTTADTTASSLVVDSPTHDFKTVKKGTVLTHIFQLRNSGTLPLHITKVEVESDDLTYALSDKVLSPKATATIALTWSTHRLSGAASEQVTITTHQSSEKTLSLTAEVR